MEGVIVPGGESDLPWTPLTPAKARVDLLLDLVGT
jgi:hypothetical protein